MKNTKIALVLAILILTVSTVTWGQATLGSGTPLAITNESADVQANPTAGGHMSHGCLLCHTPHNGGGVTVQGTTSGITTWNGACLVTAGCTGVQGAAVGKLTQGNVYLWGQALGQLTYNSWDSTGLTSFSNARVTGGAGVLSVPEVHSLMCLSCHDGATTGSSYDLGVNTATGYGGLTGTGTAQGFGPPGLNGVTWSYYNGAWSNGSLMNSHPINAHYTVGGVTLPGLWHVTINTTQYSVKFNDTNFNYWQAWSATGHPARLWTDGADAYVECTTCHEPHRFSQYAYPNNGSWNPTDAGTWEVGIPNSTVYYLRGPYSDASATTDGPKHAAVGTGNTTQNGEMNAQFCRSCHYEKSIEYFNQAGTQPD
jgi:hypothetical protein